jgi:hypothetical protein
MARERRPASQARRIWVVPVVRAALVGLLVALAAQQAGAWSRGIPNWATMIDEAQVIAVGHIAGTPVYVGHQRRPDQGTSWEFHARLRIDEVLKGTCSDQEIPIVLHYGLSPSEYIRDGKRVGLASGGVDGAIAIHDTGTTSGDGRPILQDARKPAVWLLGHYADRFGRDGKPTEELGIREPQHVQPVAMLPFLRSVLKPEPVATQLAFLHDPNSGVRQSCLRYFIDRKDTRAFPAVADLLHDPDRYVSGLAISACQLLGGKAAAPHLRPLLGSGDPDTFGWAADALASLHDAGSTPTLERMLSGGATPGQRWRASFAIGKMGDVAAIPSLVRALKDDGLTDAWNGTEMWCVARDALESLTSCRLSPNGDKAARWWEAARGMTPETWSHFGLVDAIAALPLLGPDALEQVCRTWHDRAGVPGEPLLDAMRFSSPTYGPTRVQEAWRQWVAKQGWDDTGALPSQVDDELAVTVETTAALKSGLPVRLRYTLTNRSKADV